MPDKIRAVDASIAEEMGLPRMPVIPVSRPDHHLQPARWTPFVPLNAGHRPGCMKFATDLRLLASPRRWRSPLRRTRSFLPPCLQLRNPMRCERICALSRYLMVDVLNPGFTTGTQCRFERTLWTTANARVGIAEGFRNTDAILNIMLNVTDGIVVYPGACAVT